MKPVETDLDPTALWFSGKPRLERHNISSVEAARRLAVSLLLAGFMARWRGEEEKAKLVL